MAVKARTPKESGLHEMHELVKERLTDQAKRTKKAYAFNTKLLDQLLPLLGVTREELEKRAEADFAQAQLEAARRLKKLRTNQKRRLKKRGSLRARIEAAFAVYDSREETK